MGKGVVGKGVVGKGVVGKGVVGKGVVGKGVVRKGVGGTKRKSSGTEKKTRFPLYIIGIYVLFAKQPVRARRTEGKHIDLIM